MQPMKQYLPFIRKDPVVGVIRLQGVIAAGSRGASLSDAGLAPLIEKAFRKGRPKAIALVINSPGGSPAQSSLIASRIRRLAEEKEIPVHVFVEDVAASGGYWLACAGDDITVDPNSVVGSIGVISAGFGFPEFLARYGIERRVYTSGKSKSLLDPFQPEKKADVERLKELQAVIHAGFISYVKSRRGPRIGEKDLFDGSIWVGKQAVDVGLADGVGHLVPEMKRRYGDKVRFVVHQQRKPFLGRFVGRLMGDAFAGLEERAAFARFGL
jgi:serine protease SohB